MNEWRERKKKELHITDKQLDELTHDAKATLINIAVDLLIVSIIILISFLFAVER